MITVIFFAVWRRAFGAAHLGRIQGAAQMLTVLASAIGPLIFAKCRELDRFVFSGAVAAAPCVLLFGLAAFRVDASRREPGVAMSVAIMRRRHRRYAPQVPRFAQRLRPRSRRSRSTGCCSAPSRPRCRPDYAKFELAEPPLVLSLIPGRPGGRRQPEPRRAPRAERRGAGRDPAAARSGRHPTEREEGVECCYARQTKFWITDPDAPSGRSTSSTRTSTSTGSDVAAAQSRCRSQIHAHGRRAPRAWEHRLREPIPARIPHDDNSLHEVRLEGSINARA